MERWQDKRILILGTTYPHHSAKYNETVCTGGIDEETLEMVRLYPVPMRYMEADQRFHKFQWITAQVQRHESDPRPESYRIKYDSIQLGDIVESPAVRRHYLEHSPDLVKSVEELKEKQERDQTSLGIVIPKDILDVSIDYRPNSEREEWEQAEKARAAQYRLFGDVIKPLDFPEARFMVQWSCNDERCETHNMGLSQWGIHELYRKLKNDPECEPKIIDAMQRQLDQWEKDVFLFMGNYRSVMYNFGLMDSYSAPIIHSSQPDLFS